MKIKDLIQELQNLDPTGEMHIFNCDCSDISGPILIHNGYDGAYSQVIEKDKITLCGEKEFVILGWMNFDWKLLDFPNMEVNIHRQYITPNFYNELKKKVDNSRLEAIEIDEEIKKEQNSENL